MALTTREGAFVEALLGEARGNQTKASEMAGYAAGAGLSVKATRLMKRPHVQVKVAERREHDARVRWMLRRAKEFYPDQLKE